MIKWPRAVARSLFVCLCLGLLFICYRTLSPSNPNSSSPSSSLKMSMSQRIKDLIKTHPIMIFTKSYCPHCTRVKQLFEKEVKVPFFHLDMDMIEEGGEMQAELEKLSGQRTVPNVFVGGEHLGGADATTALHREGKLLPKVKAALK